MATDQTIRVSARGEFGQLQQGLKQLQGDLKNVIGEIDKGARKGGIFDDSNLRALDAFKRRFQDSFGSLENEFDRQSKAMDKLWQRMKNASEGEQKNLQKEIDQRAKIIDQINAQMRAAQDLYNRRTSESNRYDTQSGGAGGTGGSGGRGGIGTGMLTGALSKIAGAGKVALGLAGVGGIMSLVSEAYNKAYFRQVNTLDLAQRIRTNEDSGPHANAEIYDRVGNAGMRDNMGYTKQESWAFMDQLSRQAGAVDTDEESRLLKFGRGFGISSSEVASLAGQNWQLGGEHTASKFTDDIAGSVQKSGMTPRVVEVMEANNALLQQLNTTFKDGSSRQILAYQTTLDRIGNENGMQRLTGAQGANIIGGFGGIFQPGNDKWQWMGIQALQNYNPQKYKGMGLYDLQSSFEDGLLNKDNMPAMFDLMKQQSGGNRDMFKMMVQQWLREGGYNATKSEVTQLMDVTHDGTDLSNVDDALKSIQGGNSGAKYDSERKGETGQGFLDTEARFEKALEGIGSEFVGAVQDMKKTVTSILETFNNKTDNLGGWLEKNGMALVGAMGASLLLKEAIDKLRNGAPGGSGGGGIIPFAKTAKGALKLGGIFAGVEGAYDAYHDDTKGSDYGMKSDPTFTDKWIANTWGDFGDFSGIAKFFGSKDPDFWKWTDKSQAYSLMSKLNPSSENSEWAGDLNNAYNATDTLDTTQEYKSPVSSVGDAIGGGIRKFFQAVFGMSDSGQGDVTDIGKMPKSIKELSEKGGDQLRKLNEDGTGFFKNMDRSTSSNFTGMFTIASTMFKKMLDETKSMSSMMYFLFAPLITALRSQFAGGYMNSGGSVTPAMLDAKLGGALSGYGGYFVEMGKKYGVDPSLMASISMQETGNGTSEAANDDRHNVGGMMGKNGLLHFRSIRDSIEAMARNLKTNYIDEGLTSIAQIGSKWAPIGADNDPNGLNNSWVTGVTSFMKVLGANPSSGAGGLGFLSGWKNKITSPFGDTEGRGGDAHHGLDIAEAQGTSLGALSGGIIKLVRHDEENKTSGGNTVEVQMPNGQKYLYAHMSQINPNLREGDSINQGDWLGNSGGMPGVPGSGNDTTGAHLHLGYLDQDDNLMDPQQLLNGLGVGDVTNIGKMPASLPKQTIDLNVNFNVSGAGAQELNKATQSQLEMLVRKMITQLQYEKLSMNPSIRG